jgi:hypothetical protein
MSENPHLNEMWANAHFKQIVGRMFEVDEEAPNYEAKSMRFQKAWAGFSTSINTWRDGLSSGTIVNATKISLGTELWEDLIDCTLEIMVNTFVMAYSKESKQPN